MSIIQSVINRPMLYRWHQQQQAVFTKLAPECIVVDQYQHNEDEQFKKLALADLTTLERIGFKGKDTSKWLAKQGLALTIQPNWAERLGDGTLAARLSQNEYLFLSNFANQSAACQQLKQQQITNNQLCYLLRRDHSHSWFLLTGMHSAATLAKLCGVDFRDEQFAVHQLAQTSLARTHTIMIKDTLRQTPVFHLLCDSTSQEYMWQYLIDAMAEFDGKPIGVSCLKSQTK